MMSGQFPDQILDPAIRKLEQKLEWGGQWEGTDRITASGWAYRQAFSSTPTVRSR